MKRKFLLFMALCAGLGTVVADNVTVENTTVPIGGQATIVVRFQFDVAEQYSGWQFSLELPDGITTLKDSKGNPTYTIGGCYDSSYTFSSSAGEETDDFVALSLQSSPIVGTEGVLLGIPVTCSESQIVGSSFSATLKGVQFGNVDGVHTTFIDDVTFTITIGEPADTRTVLDEKSTVVPEAATGVDVRVIRTIKANEWSTICLPFSMTAAQVVAAFGDDVQLGDFTGTETVLDDNDNVVGITAFFSAVASIEANHPYIIKVSDAVSEFTVDGIDINADEDEAYIEFDNGKSGSRRVVYSGFYGTYHAGTILDEFILFLNGNKFWYSSGLTTMKAYRAFFEFLDVLTDVENALGARVSIYFGDKTPSGISDHQRETMDNAIYYDLQGRPVEMPAKGMYVTKGKKVVVK